MNIDKDYYSVLGILPSAEPVVIKAAYRALSKRYHPDIYQGTNPTEKMAEINEAYGVLSNEESKLEYDEARGVESQNARDFFNDDFGQNNTTDPLDGDWEVAVKYQPDLEIAAARLNKYSRKLAYSYKAYMLETKDFDNIYRKGSEMTEEFLGMYFGENEELITFAKELFSDGRTDILLELNRAIKVLGVSNASAKIIDTVQREFSYKTQRGYFTDFMLTIDPGYLDYGQAVNNTLFELWKIDPKTARAKAINRTQHEKAKSGMRNWVLLMVVVFIFFFIYFTTPN